MKKLISIPLILLLVFSGISVKVATHFCGGHVAATKISLNGEMASCGMESHDNHNSGQDAITNHCCDDVLSAYSFSNDYVRSSFSAEKPFDNIISQFTAPFDLTIIQYLNSPSDSKHLRPPGDNLSNSTDQQVLCIFRI